MARIACPKCTTVIESQPGQKPLCPTCGFGGPSFDAAKAAAHRAKAHAVATHVRVQDPNHPAATTPSAPAAQAPEVPLPPAPANAPPAKPFAAQNVSFGRASPSAPAAGPTGAPQNVSFTRSAPKTPAPARAPEPAAPASDDPFAPIGVPDEDEPQAKTKRPVLIILAAIFSMLHGLLFAAFGVFIMVVGDLLEDLFGADKDATISGAIVLATGVLLIVLGLLVILRKLWAALALAGLMVALTVVHLLASFDVLFGFSENIGAGIASAVLCLASALVLVLPPHRAWLAGKPAV